MSDTKFDLEPVKRELRKQIATLKALNRANDGELTMLVEKLIIAHDHIDLVHHLSADGERLRKSMLH